MLPCIATFSPNAENLVHASVILGEISNFHKYVLNMDISLII